jgi:hypothetical protein
MGMATGLSTPSAWQEAYNRLFEVHPSASNVEALRVLYTNETGHEANNGDLRPLLWLHSCPYLGCQSFM